MDYMTDKDWEEVDKSSRQQMIEFLSCQISADGIYESTGNCSYDISVMINGKRVGIEIKDRNCDLSSFGDMMITDYKYNCNMRRLGTQFDRFWIVSFYKDHKFAMVSIKDPDMRIQKKRCNYTTLVKGASNDKVEKTCYIYPQRVKFQKTENGKWRRI